MIPDEVRRFLLGAIPSVPHLEALLLLHADPCEEWTATRLAARLYVDDGTAARVLAELAAGALLQRTGDGYRFDGDDPQRVALVSELAAVYARQVVAVTQLIHSTADRKAQHFADAFRLRREP